MKSQIRPSRELRDRTDFISYQWMFGEFPKSSNTFQHLAEKNAWQPPMDIYEINDELHIVLELAGMDKSQINIAVQGNYLHIYGVRREAAPPMKRNYHTMEINFGPFERMVFLPEEYDRENIGARFNNGFLELTIPKLSQAESKEIRVKIT